MRTQLTGKEAGFSLIELMIVVGLIGILTTMAIPRFQAFQAKAKMGEAKSLLTHIHTLEQSYQLDNNAYTGWSSLYGRNGANLNCTRPNEAKEIGFQIQPCEGPVPRYGYRVEVPNPTTSFTAKAETGAGTANLVCPGDPKQILTMNQDKLLGKEAGSLNGCE